MEIIDRVLGELDKRGLKMSELCQFLGIGTSTMANWKTRHTDPPAKYIAPICEFLKVSTDYLLTGTEILQKSDELKNLLAQLDDGTDRFPNKILRDQIALKEKMDAESQKKIALELTEDEQKVLKYYRKLTDEQKDYIKGEMAHLNMANKQDAEFANEQAT